MHAYIYPASVHTAPRAPDALTRLQHATMPALSHALLLLALSGLPHPAISQPSIVTATPPFANGSTFDYVVIGGGTAGLTVAARLAAALPAVRVLTLEAGTDNRTSPEIFSLLEFTAVFGGPLDWSWPTDEGRTLNG